MAYKNKGAKHLTELTFGIEDIKKSLEEVQELVEKASKEAGETFSKNFQQSLGDIKAEKPIDLGLDEKQIEYLKSKINEMSTEVGGLTKLTLEYQEGNKIASKATADFYEKGGNQAKIYYDIVNGKLQEQKRLITENSGLAEKEKKKEQKARTDTISSIDTLIKKQKEFTNVVSKQKKTPINKEIVEKSKQLTKQLDELNEEIQKGNVLTEEQKAQYAKLKKEIKELAGEYQEAGYQGESFLKKISDKAKWVSAFYIVDAFKDGLQESVKVIKETEDAAVQLQRVLKQDVGQTDISDKLYNIASTYGRTFADVQEVAVKFAQTGASWNDTLKLTESTMLALNTAELDVQQSTDGLIAIMSQWNMEAKDMQSIIDKINITADSFTVTSEKIVAALQRTSGSAKQAGLSIEETIGVITRLSEATGRSGENIGTALNSLLIYTSKAKALETFYEVGNESVKRTVDAYRTGSASILDVWKALSQNLEQLSEQQKTALLGGIETDKLTEELEQQATDVADAMKKIYGSAGTFRQNYLAALLGDMSTVDEVTARMADAAGYSVKENEKYMKTMTAQFEQFINALKELAVQFGNSGMNLSGFIKSLLGIGTAFAKIMKPLGGLNTLLPIFLALLTKAKQEQIENSKVVESLVGGWQGLVKSVKNFNGKIVDVITGQKSIKEAFARTHKEVKSGVAVFAKWQLAIGLATAAYSAISSIIQKSYEIQDEARQKRIEAADASLEEAKSIEVLYNEFVQLKSKTERTADEQERFQAVSHLLAKELKVTATNADGTAQSFENLAKKIMKAKKAFEPSPLEIEQQTKDYLDELETAGKDKGLFGIRFNKIRILPDDILPTPKEVQDRIYEIFKDFEHHNETTAQGFDLAPKGDYEGFMEATRKAIDYLREYSNKNKEATDSLLPLNESLRAVENTLGPAYDKFKVWTIYLEKVKNAVPETADEFNKLREETVALAGDDEKLAKIVGEMVDSYFPNFATSAETVANSFSFTAEQAEAVSDSISRLNGLIDDSQAGFDALYSAVEEYNTQGYFSVDTIQSLISAGYDYINLLEFTKDGVRLNKEATDDLAKSQRENTIEMVKQSVAAEVLQIANEYVAKANGETAETGVQLSGVLSGVAAQMAALTGEAISSTAALNNFNAEMAKLLDKKVPAGFDWDGFNRDANQAIQSGKNIIEQLNKTFDNVGNYGSKTAKNTASDAARAAREATQAQKRELEEQKRAVKDRYDFEKRQIQDAKEAAQDRYESQKQILEDEKQAIEDRYDAEIDALKEVQKENDRKDKQEEYLKRKREAEKDIAKASVRSGVEYREQEAEAREKLAEIESDREKELRDEAVEDQIDALEKQKEAALRAIDDQMEALERRHEAEMKLYEERLKKLEEQKETELKALEEKVKRLEESNQQMLSNYQSNYLNPATKETEEKYDKTFQDVNTIHSTLTSTMVDTARTGASQIYRMYHDYFIEPLKKDLSTVNGMLPKASSVPSSQIQTPNRILPSAPNGSRVDSSRPNNYYNNTRTSNNVVANVYSENAARGLSGRFFTKI